MRFAMRRGLESATATLLLFTALLFFAPDALSHPQSPVILFDEGHGMHFIIGKDGPLDLSQLADLIRQQGAVVAGGREKLTGSSLADKKALIISGPFTPYSKEEIEALVNFVLEGGKLAIMLHIPMPVYSLLLRFNVLASKGVIRERNNIIEHKDVYFQTNALFPHMLTGDLKRFSLYGAWGLLNTKPNVHILAETSPQAWIDLNGNNRKDKTERAQSFAMVVAGRLGKGEYLIFGDDAIFQNRFLVAENRKLATNLAAWLLQ